MQCRACCLAAQLDSKVVHLVTDKSPVLRSHRVHLAEGLGQLFAFLQIVAMLTTMDTAQLADREDDLLDDCLAHLRYSIEDPFYAARRYAALTHPFLIMKLYGTPVCPSPSQDDG